MLLPTRAHFSHVTRERHELGERGLIIVSFMFSLLTLLLFVGLAIDAGNLYFTRLGAQSAADAGALSGLALIAQQRPDNIAVNGARRTAWSNLVANGINPLRFNFNQVNAAVGGLRAFYNVAEPGRPNIGVMRVHIDIDVPLYVMGGLPGVGATRRVSVVGRAQMRPSNISLILDASESMSCPQIVIGGNQSCPCVPNCNQSPGAGSRIEALRIAATNFVQNFDTAVDAINVVAYGHGAELIVPFRPSGGRGFNMAGVTNAIAGITAQGATNVSDGLITAYVDALQSLHTNDASYILFSDGAATAGRFTLTPESLGPQINANRVDIRNNVIPGAPAWANYDWIQWSITQGANSFPNRFYLNPPPTPGTYTNYWNKRAVSSAYALQPPAEQVAGALPNSVSIESSGNPVSAFIGPVGGQSRLLRRLEVMFPNGTTARLGRGGLYQANGDIDWSRWIPQSEHLWIYNDLAIAWSDYIRNNGGQVYVIGYGQGAADAPVVPNAGINCSVQHADCSDAYQNALLTQTRKDIANRRMALTVCGWNDPFFFSTQAIPPIQTQLFRNARSIGEYYAVSNAQNIRNAFARIAIQIKMRRATNL